METVTKERDRLSSSVKDTPRVCHTRTHTPMSFLWEGFPALVGLLRSARQLLSSRLVTALGHPRDMPHSRGVEQCKPEARPGVSPSRAGLAGKLPAGCRRLRPGPRQARRQHCPQSGQHEETRTGGPRDKGVCVLPPSPLTFL